MEAHSQEVARFAGEVQRRQLAERERREELEEARRQTGLLTSIRNAVQTPPTPEEVESIFDQ